MSRIRRPISKERRERSSGWARVAAIALNTSDLDEDAARAATADAERETGLVSDDVVRFGPERVLDAVLRALDSAAKSPA